MGKYNVIDLFCGCGGLSYGFEQAGFNVLLGIDNDAKALETFELKPNFTYLGNKYNFDPRTAKKYYEGYNGKSTTRVKPVRTNIQK